MTTLKTFFKKNILRLYKITRVTSILKIFKLVVGKNVNISKTSISGRTTLGNNVSLINSTLNGQIKISNHSVINKSTLTGDIDLSNNCTLYNTNIDGKFKCSQKSYLEHCFSSGNINIGNNVKIIGGQVTMCGDIEIGNYTSLNGPNTDIYTSINKVKIGNFCSIARNVSIQEYNHKTNKVSTYFMSSSIYNLDSNLDKESKGDIIIENDVWIGSQTIILTGSKVSNGAVIAANSVVTGYIPPLLLS